VWIGIDNGAERGTKQRRGESGSREEREEEKEEGEEVREGGGIQRDRSEWGRRLDILIWRTWRVEERRRKAERKEKKK